MAPLSCHVTFSLSPSPTSSPLSNLFNSLQSPPLFAAQVRSLKTVFLDGPCST
ncbi:hypothetical protein R3P38DRAFT_3298251 [Favolaschia claudopus]|uniref:Uncharacterized protein n=1 Tax=Favolaschia claudopus TaxID=2862362 RepID=A0AAV9Z388_9AGAR